MCKIPPFIYIIVESDPSNEEDKKDHSRGMKLSLFSLNLNCFSNVSIILWLTERLGVILISHIK